MPNFFYYDANGQKFGPVNDQQLKALATQGIIVPQTPLETDSGHRGTAGQIPGLCPAMLQPTILPQQPTFTTGDYLWELHTQLPAHIINNKL
jgi:hypothetical protein